MSARAVPTAGSKPLGLWVVIISIAFFAWTESKCAPFALHGPGVNTNDFRVTAFATNLSYHLVMARLGDWCLKQGAHFLQRPGPHRSTRRRGSRRRRGRAPCRPLFWFAGRANIIA